MPETVVVREAQPKDAAGIARVHVDSWRTTYPGIMPAEFLASLSYEDREQMWTRILSAGADQRQAVFVAEDGDDHIVGFASCGPPGRGTPPEYTGELRSIYLLQSHQGRGIGRLLFREVVEKLARNGCTSLFVWVARDNPSRGFYEALGGRLLQERRDEVFGQQVDEAGYGWDDIQALRTRLGRERQAG